MLSKKSMKSIANMAAKVANIALLLVRIIQYVIGFVSTGSYYCPVTLSAATPFFIAYKSSSRLQGLLCLAGSKNITATNPATIMPIIKLFHELFI